ncbi:UMP kinase [Candidatus Woesearchaeota archaeon]|nr:UMP kinase [Candidatus Woesearchaeota archaeon]
MKTSPASKKIVVTKTIIISLGGSLIVPDKVDVSFLQQLKALIMIHLAETAFRFVIVCGGGKPAREYQEAARKLCVTSSTDLDWVGIMATRLNAELVRAMFGEDAHPTVVTDPHQPIKSSKNVIVAAGYQPGHSTDMDAVLLAQQLHAELVINLSNIDYVYDKNPAQFKNAQKFESMSWKELRALVGDAWKPGMNVPFDPIAAKEAEKTKLKVIVANGKDIDNLGLILSGRKFKGTVVG